MQHCPVGTVPAWSCSRGALDNFGTRRACRSCGREAPEHTQRAQRKAVAQQLAKEEAKPATRTVLKAKPVGQRGTDRKVAWADLKDDSDDEDNMDEEAQETSSEVAKLKAELTKLGETCKGAEALLKDNPGNATMQQLVRELDQQYKGKRDEDHKAWPMPRQRRLAEKRIQQHKAKTTKLVDKTEASAKRLEELRAALANA